MLRLRLTDEARTEVQALRRDRRLRPAERDRVEMILLLDGGMAVPQVARHLGYCRATVRRVLRAYEATGLAALRRQRPGPAKDDARRAQVTAALDRLLATERTWTAAQLATALDSEGISLSTRQTRKYLQGMGARWRRTAHTLKHKQDPKRAADAEAKLTLLKKNVPPASSNSPSLMRSASVPASR